MRLATCLLLGVILPAARAARVDDGLLTGEAGGDMDYAVMSHGSVADPDVLLMDPVAAGLPAADVATDAVLESFLDGDGAGAAADPDLLVEAQFFKHIKKGFKKVHGFVKSIFGGKGKNEDEGGDTTTETETETTETTDVPADAEQDADDVPEDAERAPGGGIHGLLDALDCGEGRPALQVAWGWLKKRKNNEETASRDRNNCRPGANAATGGADAETAAREAAERAKEEEERAERDAEEAAEAVKDDAENADGAHTEDGDGDGDGEGDGEKKGLFHHAIGAFRDLVGEDSVAGKVADIAGRLVVTPRDDEEAEMERREAEAMARSEAGGKAGDLATAEHEEAERAREHEREAQIASEATALEREEAHARDEERRARDELRRAHGEADSAHSAQAGIDREREKLRLEREDLEEKKRQFEESKKLACRGIAREESIAGKGGSSLSEDDAIAAVDRVMDEEEREEEGRLDSTTTRAGKGGASVHVRSRKTAAEREKEDEERAIARYRREKRDAEEKRELERRQFERDDRKRRKELASRVLERDNADNHDDKGCKHDHDCPVGDWAEVEKLLRTGKIVAKFDHFDTRGGKDGASAMDNIRDAAKGHRVLRSVHGDAPGGSVCASPELAELIVKVADLGVVEINSVVGSSHKWQTNHYEGHSVDFGSLGDDSAEEKGVAIAIAKACKRAGASQVLNAYMDDCDDDCEKYHGFVHCAI